MDAAIWLRREWLYWSRLVRYYVLTAGAVRALDAKGVTLRRLAQATLVALLLLVGGYFLGRVTAPGCSPLAATPVCTEAQVLPPPVPAALALAPQIVVVTAEVTPPAPDLPSIPAVAMLSPPTVDAIPPLPENKQQERGAALTNDEVREMQAWLKVFGFDPGPIDGYPGSRTKAAVKRYQAARRTEETGEVDRLLLRRVRREAGHS